jgi:hypothetical protein
MSFGSEVQPKLWLTTSVAQECGVCRASRKPMTAFGIVEQNQAESTAGHDDVVVVCLVSL